MSCSTSLPPLPLHLSFPSCISLPFCPPLFFMLLVLEFDALLTSITSDTCLQNQHSTSQGPACSSCSFPQKQCVVHCISRKWRQSISCVCSFPAPQQPNSRKPPSSSPSPCSCFQFFSFWKQRLCDRGWSCCRANAAWRTPNSSGRHLSRILKYKVSNDLRWFILLTAFSGHLDAVCLAVPFQITTQRDPSWKSLGLMQKQNNIQCCYCNFLRGGKYPRKRSNILQDSDPREQTRVSLVQILLIWKATYALLH